MAGQINVNLIEVQVMPWFEKYSLRNLCDLCASAV